jgi:hypothetical protein
MDDKCFGGTLVPCGPWWNTNRVQIGEVLNWNTICQHRGVFAGVWGSAPEHLHINKSLGREERADAAVGTKQQSA